MSRLAPVRNLKVRVWLLVGLAASLTGTSSGAATPSGLNKACVAHITRWAEQRDIIPGVTVGVQDGKVIYGRNSYTNFAVEVDDELDTLRYFNKLGRVPASLRPDAALPPRVLMPYLHGNGSLRSQGASALASMNLLMSLKNSGLAGELKALTSGEQSIWVPIATESVDMPGHGTGPDLDQFEDMDKLLDWMAIWFRQLRRHNLPIIPIARSASPAYLAAFAHKYPDLIDGLVLVSPMHPVIGLDENIRTVEERIAQIPPFPGGPREQYVEWVEERLKAGDFIVNRPGLNWCFDMYRQMSRATTGPLAWHHNEDPFNGKPTLILVGEADWQVPGSVRDAFHDMAKRAAERGTRSGNTGRHTTYRQYPGMGHDLLAVAPREAALNVYTHFYQFVTAVLGDHPAPRSMPVERPSRTTEESVPTGVPSATTGSGEIPGVP